MGLSVLVVCRFLSDGFCRASALSITVSIDLYRGSPVDPLFDSKCDFKLSLHPLK